MFLQIGQFLRVQQSIDLLNAHGAQGQAHDPDQTGGKKTEQKLALALRLRLEACALVLQSLPGPMKDLAAIGRAFREHHPDFAKRVIKDFMQEKNGTLWRAESLEQA